MSQEGMDEMPTIWELNRQQNGLRDELHSVAAVTGGALGMLGVTMVAWFFLYMLWGLWLIIAIFAGTMSLIGCIAMRRIQSELRDVTEELEATHRRR